MRHRVAGRKLGRTTEHRTALLRNLSTALFDKERITTTLIKAKELRPFAEKLVTMAKRETLHARRQVLRHIHDRTVVAKLFDSLSARYAERPGGYTRIIKLGARRGDNAEMAVIELVGAEESTLDAAADDEPQAEAKQTKAKVKKKKTAKAAAKKAEPAKKKKTTKKAAGKAGKKSTTKKSGAAKSGKKAAKKKAGKSGA